MERVEGVSCEAGMTSLGRQEADQERIAVAKDPSLNISTTIG
jgi:hypothetical protein